MEINTCQFLFTNFFTIRHIFIRIIYYLIPQYFIWIINNELGDVMINKASKNNLVLVFIEIEFQK